jgi:hypothetical protein
MMQVRAYREEQLSSYFSHLIGNDAKTCKDNAITFCETNLERSPYAFALFTPNLTKKF